MNGTIQSAILASLPSLLSSFLALPSDSYKPVTRRTVGQSEASRNCFRTASAQIIFAKLKKMLKLKKLPWKYVVIVLLLMKKKTKLKGKLTHTSMDKLMND